MAPVTHRKRCYDSIKPMIGRANAYLDAIDAGTESPSVVNLPRDLRALVLAEYIQFATGLEVPITEGKKPRLE